MPRRFAWLLFFAAAILFFLDVVRVAFTAGSLPVWLDSAGLCALALGCVAWTIPGNPVP